MAETRTSRMGMPQWSAGTDSPSRADINEAFLSVENNTAMFLQGTRAARPAAGKQGRFYVVTETGANNGIVFYDTGTTWIMTSLNMESAVIRAATSGANSLIVQGAASQTADLVLVQNSGGTNLLQITSDGGVRAVSTSAIHSFGGAANSTARTTIYTVSSSTRGLVIQGAASQSVNLQEWLNSSGTLITNVNQEGSINAALTGGNVSTRAGSSIGGAGKIGTQFTVLSGAASNHAISAVGVASQTGDLFRAENSSGTAVFQVNAAGKITSVGGLDVKLGVTAAEQNRNVVTDATGKLVAGPDVTTVVTVNDSQVITNKNFNDSNIYGNKVSPIGSVTAFAGSSTPTGWLFCDGTAVSRSVYSELFAVIGTTYGGGDGSTTFNLPDTRDRFMMGSGYARGLGQNEGLAVNDRNGRIAHSISAWGSSDTQGYHGHGVSVPTNGGIINAQGGGGQQTAAWAQYSTHGHNIYGDGNHTHNIYVGASCNEHPYIGFRMIIKALR